MKKHKSPEAYLFEIEENLENANYHDFVELPRKLFNKIVNLECACFDTNDDEINLARAITEEFNKSI